MKDCDAARRTEKTITLAHKVRLRPTPTQANYLFRAAAAARHAFNWGKEQLDAEFDMLRELGLFGLKFNNFKVGYSHPVYELKKHYNTIKPDWVKRNNGTATQEAFANLHKAMVRYRDIRKGKIILHKLKKSRRDGKPRGWPKWRNRRKHVSFRVTNIALKVDGLFVTYNTGEVGAIRMCEELRFSGKLMNATFSWDGFYWHASFQVQMTIDIPAEHNGLAVGVDLGVKYLAVTSDDKPPYPNPAPLKNALEKLAKLQRRYSRSMRLNNPDCYDEGGKPIDGKRMIKTNRAMVLQTKIKKLHLRIANIRSNSSHHLTAELTKQYGYICLEDLNVRGMMQNGKLSKSIADAAFGEKRRQFEYKAELNGGQIIIVNRWYPSSKTCNSCRRINTELKLAQREWTCEECGIVNERDDNASKNLRDEGIRIVKTARRSAGGWTGANPSA